MVPFRRAGTHFVDYKLDTWLGKCQMAQRSSRIQNREQESLAVASVPPAPIFGSLLS
jgi:hypothetical protein